MKGRQANRQREYDVWRRDRWERKGEGVKMKAEREEETVVRGRKMAGMQSAGESRRTQGYRPLHQHAPIGWSVSYCGPARGRRD